MPDDKLKKLVARANTIQDDQDRLFDAGRYAGEQRTISELGLEPMGKYDEGVTPYHDHQGQNTIRAQNMTGWQARGNALAQVVAEVGLGTAEGIGYLLDFQQYESLLAGDEREFGNWFSDIMRSGKDWVGEEFPIYGGEGFQPLSGRWWSRNAGSIASTLSLMVPAAGGVKALSSLGKFAKGKKMLEALAKVSTNSSDEAAAFANQLSGGVKGLQGALLSRYMENTMEAAEVMESTIHELIGLGVSEEEAREKAGEAAASTWWANNVALLTDIPQYMMMFKLPSALKAIGEGKGKFSKVKDIVATMVSEAGEEAYQYGVQQASKNVEGGNAFSRTARVIQKMMQEAPEYIEDPEFWTSVTLGAVGGGIFATAGAAINSKINKVHGQYREVQELVAKGKEIQAQAKMTEATVDAVAEDPQAAKNMADIAEGSEDPIQVNETKNVINDVEKEKALRSDDRLGEEKAKDVAKAKANQRAAQKAEEQIQELIADKGTPIEEGKPVKSDSLSEAYDTKIKDLKKKYKGNEAALKIIDQLEKKYNEEKNKRVNRYNFENSPDKAAINNLIEQKVEEEFNAAYRANQVNKTSTPKGEQEYIEDKVNQEKKEYSDRVDSLLEENPTPDQLIELGKQLDAFPELQDKLRKKYQEGLDKELKNIIPPGEEVDSYEAWLEGVLAANPFIKYTKDAIEPKLKKLWNESRPKQEVSKISVGDRFKTSSGIIEVLEVGDNEARLQVYSPDGTPLVQTTNSLDILQQQLEEDTLVPIDGIQEPSTKKPEVQEDRNKIIVEDTSVEEADEFDTLPAPQAENNNAKKGRFLLLSFDMQMSHNDNNELEFSKTEDGYLKEDDWLDSQLGDNLATAEETRKFRRKFADYVGDPQGVEVRYVIDRTIPFNRSDNVNKNNVLIHAVVKYAGKWYSIGVVPAINEKRSGELSTRVIDNIKEIRNELWENLQNSEDTMVLSNNTVGIKSVLKGHFLNLPISRTLDQIQLVSQNNQTEGILPNGKLYLAIGTKEGDLFKGELTEQEESELKVLPLTNPKKGRTYMLVKAPDGYSRWARVYTVPVEERPELKEEVLSQLKMAEEAHRELVEFEKTLDILTAARKQRLISEELRKKDTRLPKLKKWIEEWSDARATIQEIVRYRKETKPGDYKLEPDFRANLFTVKKYQDENGIFSAQKFYDLHQLDTRPLQIDASQINSPGYNSEVATRLKTDLDSSTAYHSPSFEMEFYKSSEESPSTTTAEEKVPRKRKRREGFKAREIKPGSYKKIDIQKAVKWLEDRLPAGVSVQVVKGVIRIGNTRAWGVTRNAAIALSDVAAEGTEYWEHFRVVFNNFFTETEQRRLLTEAKKEYGDLGDTELERRLAQEYMLFVQDASTITGRIKRFFRRILEFMGLARTNYSTIEAVFRGMERGDFKTRPVINRQFDPKFRRVGSLSPSQVREVVAIGLNELEITKTEQGVDKTDYASVLNPDPELDYITSFSIEDSVVNILLDHMHEYKDVENFNKDLMLEIIRLLRPDFKGVDEEGTPITEGTPEKGVLYREFLSGIARRGFQIKFKNGKVLGPGTSPQSREDVVPYDENQDTREWWAIEEISISPKEQLSARLKRWINNILIPNEQDSMGLGFDKFYSGNEVYPLLQRELGNSYSFNDMMKRINESSLPLMIQIKNQLADYESNPETMALATDLYKHVAQNQHPAYKVLNINKFKDERSSDEVTHWRLFDSNTFSLGKTILNEFSDEFKEDKAKEALDALNKIFKNSPEIYKNREFDPKRIIKAMEFVGFKIPAVVKEAMTPKKAYYIALAFKKGLSGSKDFGLRFKKLVDQIKPLYPQDYQDTHFDVAGKKVYEWSNSTFFGRMLNMANRNWKAFKDHYYRDPLYTNLPILNKYGEGGKNPLQFEFAIVDGIKEQGRKKGVKYNEFSDREMLLTQLAYYYNNGNKSEAHIMLPILSDSPTLGAVKVPKKKKLNGAGGVYEELEEVLKYEWDRIKRKEQNNTKNFVDNKERALLFKPFEDLLTADTFDTLAIKERIKEVVGRYQIGVMAKLEELGLVVQNEGKYIPSEDFDSRISDIPNFVRQFVAHHMLYHSQLILLSTGDPAFYKKGSEENNLGDFYKRAKEIWSPGIYLNAKNVYVDPDGNIISVGMFSKNGKMRWRVLPDSLQQVTSEHYDTIAEIIGEENAEAYKRIEVADGQTYIDLIAWRDREIGLNGWTDQKQAAFDILVAGGSVKSEDVKKLNRETRKLIHKADTLEEKSRLKRQLIPTKTSDQPYKPYVFTHRIVNNILTPTQKKDSEFIMLPIYGVEGHPLYNEEYRKYMEDMGYDFDTMSYKDNLKEVRKYDAVTFESTIKVGNFASFEEGDTVIEVDFTDWRKQQEIPEHHINADEKFGTQIMKLIIADLESGEYTLPSGEAISKEDLIEEYSQLIIEDVRESYAELEGRLKGDTAEETFNNLLSILREEILNRDMGDQYLEALEDLGRPVAGNQTTKLPLWHPLHANRIESLLNSIFRKNVTDQKFSSGGSFVNTSAWGFKRKPKLKFSSDGKRLLAVECYIPMHNKYLKRYANEQGYILEDGMERIRQDIKDGKLPDLLHGIVYRIPTEDKYSMFNIEVIGFLPSDAGSIIMPEEVTTIAGLDFDIDKVKGFFYGGQIVHPDIEQEFLETLKEQRKELTSIDDQKIWNNAIQMIEDANNLRKNRFTSEGREMIKDFLEEDLHEAFDNLTNEELEIINKSRYTIGEESLKAQYPEHFNILATIKSAITEYNNMVNDFYAQAKESMEGVQNIHSNIGTISNLISEVYDERDANRYMTYNEKTERDNRKLDLMRAVLMSEAGTKINLNPGNFENIKANNRDIVAAQKPEPVVDYLNPLTLVNIARRMNAGKALIGFAANYNSSHALWMNYKENIKLLKPFRFEGKGFNNANFSNLGEEFDATGKRVTENISEMLAAFVDNGKDPQADYFNMNTFTADVALSMLATGVPLRTVQYFLANPVIRRITKQYFDKGATKQAENEIYSQAEDKYGDLSFFSPTDKISMKELEDNIEATKDAAFGHKIIKAFLVYKKRANKVADLIRATKLGDAGAGPTQPDNLNKIQTWEEDFSGYIYGANDFLNLIKLIEEEDNVEAVPHENTFTKVLYKEGIAKANEFIVKEGGFPNLNTVRIKNILDLFKFRQGFNLSVEDVTTFYRDLTDYIASGFELFQDAKDSVDYVESNLDKMQDKYPDNKFLNRLTINNGIVEFKALTGTDNSEEQEIREDWEDLFYGEDRKFAVELVRYTYARNGFKFAFNGFSHLQPVSFYADLQDSNGQYLTDYMYNNLKALDTDPSRLSNFINQFIDNNYENQQHVPRVRWGKNEKNPNVNHVESYKGVPYFIDTGLKSEFTFNLPGSGRPIPHPFIKMKVGKTTYLFKHAPAGAVEGFYKRVATKSTRIEGNKVYQYYNINDNTTYIAEQSRFQKFLNENMDKLVDQREEYTDAPMPGIDESNPLNDYCNTQQ